jgi:hypothetical protein
MVTLLLSVIGGATGLQPLCYQQILLDGATNDGDATTGGGWCYQLNTGMLQGLWWCCKFVSCSRSSLSVLRVDGSCQWFCVVLEVADTYCQWLLPMLRRLSTGAASGSVRSVTGGTTGGGGVARVETGLGFLALSGERAMCLQERARRR